MGNAPAGRPGRTDFRVVPDLLPFGDGTVHALLFVPEGGGPEGGADGGGRPALAAFAHGYTSHKGDLVPWALRLAGEGLPTAVFDLPGHLLGGPSAGVASLDDFARLAPALFPEALGRLGRLAGTGEGAALVLGGHSLGALLSLLALPLLGDAPTLSVCAGLGSRTGGPHLYETPFFREAAAARGKLVVEALAPGLVFPWAEREKASLAPSGRRIHLVCGQDDVVVGKDGGENLRRRLEGLGNDATLDSPARLPHHDPGAAAPHVAAFLRRERARHLPRGG